MLKRFIIGFLLISISCVVQSEEGWTLRKEGNGIKVFTKKVENSEFNAFRAETVVDATLSTLMAVHADVEYVNEWLKDCSEAQLLTEFDPNGYAVYFKTDSPWPVKDRDYTVKYTIEQDPADYTLTINFTAEVGLVPESDDCVRITVLDGFWKMKPVATGGVNVIYQVSTDPGGGVPAWLANSFVIDQPFHSLTKLHERVKMKKYQGKSFEFVKEPH